MQNSGIHFHLNARLVQEKYQAFANSLAFCTEKV
jgi:hypothetical protein